VKSVLIGDAYGRHHPARKWDELQVLSTSGGRFHEFVVVDSFSEKRVRVRTKDHGTHTYAAKNLLFYRKRGDTSPVAAPELKGCDDPSDNGSAPPVPEPLHWSHCLIL
jgi:hypothetical protein